MFGHNQKLKHSAVLQCNPYGQAAEKVFDIDNVTG